MSLESKNLEDGGSASSPFGSAQVPTAQENEATPIWTPQRRELREWFQRKAPHLGALYESALILLHNPSFPARERLIAHAVREIGNRLPNAVGTKVEKTKRVDATNRLDEIVAIWKRDKLPVDFSTPISAPSADSIVNGGVVLPERTARAMAALIGDHARSREKRKDAAIRLLREIAPDSGIPLDQLRPIALRWFEVLDWFQKNVHVPEEDKAVSEDDFQRHFSLFEQYLGSMLRPFFSTLKDVNELLDDANR